MVCTAGWVNAENQEDSERIKTMKVLYLSSLCSIKEYERMFKAYGSTSSHASQKFNRMLVDGLIANDCEVDALTQRIIVKGGENDLTRPDEEENGTRYKYLPRYANKKKNRLMTIWNAWREIRKWKQRNPDGVVICDIILGELSIATWLSSLGSSVKNYGIVTDVPGIRAGDQRKGIKAIPQKIKDHMISIYDGYVFLTEKMNERLNKKNKPYVVVEGMVDQAVLDIPNTVENKYPEAVCMMAGLLEDIFGVSALLKAFMKTDNENARLLFYGKGSAVPEINTCTEKDPRIKYCGELTNQQIVAEEKKATLLINPRPAGGEWTSYSFPSKNMEYMASGTPLVAYDLPCIPREYLPYFFRISGEDQLAVLLDELLSKDKDELHAFGLEAQRWVVAHKNAVTQAKKIKIMLQ